MKNVNGKVAFVTGAANGIGLAICRALARAGAQVALADIQPDALESARQEIAALGVNTIALSLDVSDADAMARAADEVEAAFSKVHIVCNNAGVAVCQQSAAIHTHRVELDFRRKHVRGCARRANLCATHPEAW